MIRTESIRLAASISVGSAKGGRPRRNEILHSALATGISAIENRVFATIQDQSPEPNRFPSAVYIMQSSFQPLTDEQAIDSHDYSEVYLVGFTARTAAQAEQLWREAANLLERDWRFALSDGGRDYYDDEIELFQKYLIVTVH